MNAEAVAVQRSRPWEDGNDILLAALDEIGLPKRMVNELPRYGISLVGQLIQRSEAELFRLPNLGRTSVGDAKTILERYSLNFGMQLHGWDDAAAIAERRRLGRELLRRLWELNAKQAGEAECLEDELLGLLRLVEDDRNVKLLASLYGFDGSEPKTLDRVGQSYNLTRERVRQLGDRAKIRLAKMWHPMPKLSAAIACVRELEPCSGWGVADELKRREITRAAFHAGAVIAAVELVGVRAGLDRHTIQGEIIYASAHNRQAIRQIIYELRRATSAAGCTSIERLALAAEWPIEQGQKVRQLLSSIPETIWLDQSKTWVMSSRTARNRLINYSEKVFVALPQVGIGELRRSLSRHHRIDYVPSNEALATLVEQNGLAHRVGDQLVRDRIPGIERLGVNDSALLKAFKELSSPASREDLEEICIGKLGMNATSFYMHLAYSPLVLKLATGVYALIGADVPVGAVEKIRADHLANRPPTEHGWTSDGKLWCLGVLDRISMTSGSRALPSYIASMAGGSWSCVVAGGLSAGNARVERGFISGLKPAFSLLAAEPDDFIRLTFDLVSRVVEVRVGGSELSEEPAPVFDEDDCDYEDGSVDDLQITESDE